MYTNDNEFTTATSVASLSAGRIKHLDVTIGIVMAYVSNNSLRADELPSLIGQVHAAVIAPSAPVTAPSASSEAAKPAIVKKSITPEALISFIDGKPYKTLKRHLGSHGLDIDAYRTRYGLPADYPVVSASYSAARSALAKELGLGRATRKPRPYEPIP